MEMPVFRYAVVYVDGDRPAPAVCWIQRFLAEVRGEKLSLPGDLIAFCDTKDPHGKDCPDMDDDFSFRLAG
jgi:hypothetical protein